VVLRTLRHGRNQARGRNHARSHVRELCGRAPRLRVHRAQLLRRDVLHTQTRSVDGDAVSWSLALALAFAFAFALRGNLGLHGDVRTRDDQPDSMHDVPLLISGAGAVSRPVARWPTIPPKRRGRRVRTGEGDDLPHRAEIAGPIRALSAGP
jgi:hypothetical protein